MTAFTSYFGNALLGLYIDWDVTGTTTSVATDTILTAKFSLNLYAMADQLDSGVLTDADTMYFYVLFQNPYDVFDYVATDYGPVYNELVPFDGLTTNFLLTVGAEDKTTDALKRTLLIGAPGGVATALMIDIYCLDTITEGIYASAACSPDTTNIAPKTGTGADAWIADAISGGETEFCSEFWTTVSLIAESSVEYTQRCVRIEISGKRPFISAENAALIAATTAPTTLNTYDIDLDFRPYSVSAGWIIPATATAATDVPGVIDFDAITVDFATFQSDAAKYEGGMYTMAIASTSLFAAIFSMSF